MTQHIFWISSYPKSGNTLLRSIISSIFFSDDGKFNFNLLKKIVSFEEIIRIKNIHSLYPNVFVDKNLNQRNDIIYKNMNEIQKKNNLGFEEDFAFFKTHFSAKNYNDYSFIIPKNIRGVFYIIRDPRDVIISWSKHTNITLAESCDFIINENSSIRWIDIEKYKSYPSNLPVYLSSWQNHVLSWIKNLNNIPHMIIKYEDLVYNKEKLLLNILDFFETKFNIKTTNKDLKIKNIIETTSFNFMKNMEDNLGFNESIDSKKFFSVGRKEQWKKDLEINQINKIENKFGEIMRKFQYKLSVEL
ncbi:sulfotransferase domain-containing protein [Pelagibacteraceae bacterium]|nr:sulfotransferase domain-containing protein [Pelagibacteraceae bacterium]